MLVRPRSIVLRWQSRNDALVNVARHVKGYTARFSWLTEYPVSRYFFF
jgi:hypothetical protein